MFFIFRVFWGRLATPPTIRPPPPTQKSVATPLYRSVNFNSHEGSNYTAAPQEQIYFVLKSRNFCSHISHICQICSKFLNDATLLTTGYFTLVLILIHMMLVEIVLRRRREIWLFETSKQPKLLEISWWPIHDHIHDVLGGAKRHVGPPSEVLGGTMAGLTLPWIRQCPQQHTFAGSCPYWSYQDDKRLGASPLLPKRALSDIYLTERAPTDAVDMKTAHSKRNCC